MKKIKKDQLAGSEPLREAKGKKISGDNRAGKGKWPAR